MDIKMFKEEAGILLGHLTDLVKLMPQKGNKSSECQRVYLQKCIITVEYAVRGTTAEDLIPRKLCEDCDQEFEQSEGRSYKYEPDVWLCDHCHDDRMVAEEEDV